MTPAQVAHEVLQGAHRTRTDLRSTLDLTDEVFDALVALAGTQPAPRCCAHHDDHGCVAGWDPTHRWMPCCQACPSKPQGAR